MKEKPRWMRSVIEAAKAESASMPYGRPCGNREREGDKARNAVPTKP